MQLSLSVAFHAAQTDDFAGMQVEAAAIDCDSAVVATDDESSLKPMARRAYRDALPEAEVLRRR